jgi:hypothetical protein
MPNNQQLNVVSGAGTDIVFIGTQSNNAPSTITQTGSGVTWVNPSSIVGTSGYTSAALTAVTNASSKLLNVQNFGFSIPAAINNVISVGLTCTCYCSASGAVIQPNVTAQLLVANVAYGTVQQLQMAGLPEFYFPTSPITLQVSNLLYPNALTSAQVNASSFGVQLQAGLLGNSGNTSTISIDNIQLTIGWQGGTGTTTYYTSKYGAWQRGAFKNEATFRLSSQSMELTAFLPETILFPGTSTSMMQSLIQGTLSGALVNIQTLFWPSGSSYTAGLNMGTMQLTTGQIGNVKQTGRSKVVCEVFDLTYLLNKPAPPFQIQSACRHSLFDASCTLLSSSFVTANSLATGSTQLNLNLDILPAGTPPLALGYVQFTTGQNAGLKMSIKSNSVSIAGSVTSGVFIVGETIKQGTTNAVALVAASVPTAGPLPAGPVVYTTTPDLHTWVGQTSGAVFTPTAVPVMQLQLMKFLPFAVATSDNLNIYPGCDKSIATCQNTYSNLIHFGGEPFVPSPETAS